MPLHLERIDWMPSPPLAPDDGPIDFAHLGRMTLGDAGLEREVLAMFSAQSPADRPLAALPADGRAGAYAERFGAGDRRVSRRRGGGRLEAALPTATDPPSAGRLSDAVAVARTAIDAILRRS